MPTTQDDVATSRAHRNAWFVPVLAIVLAGLFGPSLKGWGMSSTRVTALALLVGGAAGAAWQLLDRRDFVSRFARLALLPLACAVLALVVPGAFDDGGFRTDTWAAGGIVLGVVLAEAWLRRSAERRGVSVPTAEDQGS